MLQSAGMKQSLVYEQTSCRLQVEGLPDVSAGHGATSIGIITGWTLHWAGRPDLEGRREHLVALMQVVFPYARHLISDVSRGFGGSDQPVSINPGPDGLHQLSLRSSQSGVEPLRLSLDDAELADLVQVLDRLRLDQRLRLELDLPAVRPLRPRELNLRVPVRRRLAAPLGGLAALLLAAGVGSLLPLPKPQPGAAGSGPGGTGALSAPSGRPGSAPGATPAGSSDGSTNGNSADRSSSSNSDPDAALIERLHSQLHRRADRNSLRRVGFDQTWMLAVNSSGTVVAASPHNAGTASSAAALGLPAQPVGAKPPAGTTLVRADLRSGNGYWELAPWSGWSRRSPQP
ncbi:MAG: DUF4335 domain-containing protein [Synechococcaceae cyanobacterium]|nr:DUF4335 domain-containing protein [Synechococcaceae cyanobacterium]